jgi:hypothetical protein
MALLSTVAKLWAPKLSLRYHKFDWKIIKSDSDGFRYMDAYDIAYDEWNPHKQVSTLYLQEFSSETLSYVEKV